MSMILKLIHLLNRICLKNSKYILFYSITSYPDSLDLFIQELYEEKILQNFQKVIILDHTVREPKQLQTVVHCKRHSWKGIYYYIRSKYIVLDNSLYGRPPIIKNQIKLILFNGIPYKKCGYLMDHASLLRPYADYTVASSDVFRLIVNASFQVYLDHILLTGLPRLDYLYRIDNEKFTSFLKRYFKSIDVEYKNIIWMPTYRRSDNANYDRCDGVMNEFGIPILTSENIKEIDGFLGKNKINMFIKYHSLQGVQFSNLKLKHIFLITTDMFVESGYPLYEFIGHCDALISDYSSIAIEYMVLNKPICFAYDDLEEYEKTRGFAFEDVQAWMLGYHACDVHQFYNFLQDISSGKDSYEDERKKLSYLFHKYRDDQNTKRLITFLEAKIFQ